MRTHLPVNIVDWHCLGKWEKERERDKEERGEGKGRREGEKGRGEGKGRREGEEERGFNRFFSMPFAIQAMQQHRIAVTKRHSQQEIKSK